MDDARRLLNRAVAASSRDVAFVAEARRLAASHPDELLRRMLTAASLDVAQAELMHQLLCCLPDLVARAPPAGEPLLHVWLRGALTEPGLPPTRQRALLLLLARLSHAADDPAAPAVPRTARDDEPSGAPPPPRPPPLPPLLPRPTLLARVLLPLTDTWVATAAGDGTVSALPAAAAPPPLIVLQAILQLLSGQAARGGGAAASVEKREPLGDADLASLLGALLTLLRARDEMVGGGGGGGGSGEQQQQQQQDQLALQCAHAAVQLLLPRVAGAARAAAAGDAAGAWAGAAAARWRALPWPTQLQAWPLLDRLACTADPAAAAAARGGGGARLLLWLRGAARPRPGSAEEFYCVVRAAAVPAVPAKQALILLLPGGDAPPHVRARCRADAAAALARALPRGTAQELQTAAAALLPELAARDCLPLAATDLPPLWEDGGGSGGGESESKGEGEGGGESVEQRRERRVVLAAHGLLRVLLAHKAATAGGGAGAEGAEGAGVAGTGGVSARACVARERLCFAHGAARWLAAAAPGVSSPRGTLQLLGVSLRLARESPLGAARDRVALLCMQLWASLEGGVGGGGGGGDSGGGGDDGEGEGEGGRESEGGWQGGAEKEGGKETASAAVLISTVRGGLESLRARGDGGGDKAGEAGEAWLDVLEAMLCRAPPPPPPVAGSEAERPKVKPPEGWGMGMCGGKPVIVDVVSDQLSASQALAAAEMAVP